MNEKYLKYTTKDKKECENGAKSLLEK